jgi:YfiH family protein
MLFYTDPNMAKQSKLIHGFFTRFSILSSIGIAGNFKNMSDTEGIVYKTFVSAYQNLKISDQIHSASVITIYNKAEITFNKQADALVTNIPTILLGVKTADCVPILFFDTKNRIIAAAHAGWKGAFAGVIKNTIFAMKNIGADISSIVASIGPCIQQASYEVNQAFYNKFIENDIANSQFFIGSKRATHHMFDLPAYCINKLKKSGIQSINHLGIDTYSNSDILFSFRRATHENKNCGTDIKYGKQLSVIGTL